MRHLENKIAIVTDGTSGIGRAAAIALATAGAKVVVADNIELTLSIAGAAPQS